MRWFHGTSLKNAEKILKEGVLKPGHDSVYDVDIPRYNAVYIANLEIATFYAEERAGMEEGQGAVLEVVQPNLKNLVPDEDDVHDFLRHRSGSSSAAKGRLSDRVKALWLQQWNEENASYNDPERFPIYKDFEEAWEVWGNIEFEGTSGLSDQMVDLTDYIVKKDPALAKSIIQAGGKAAHIGPIKVVRQVKVAAEDAPTRPLFFKIEVPAEHRKTFWTRPNAKTEFWAFKDRPRAFLKERIVFTFDGKPVAEAEVLKIEGPGDTACDATGQYKEHHKVFWSPQGFKRYKQAKWLDIGVQKSEGQTTAFVLTEPVDVKQWIKSHADAGSKSQLTNLLEGHRVAVLDQLDVAPDNQGKGVGRGFLTEFISNARSQQAEIAVLVADAEREQPTGINLTDWYKRFGFEVIGKDVFGFPIMYKELKNIKTSSLSPQRTAARTPAKEADRIFNILAEAKLDGFGGKCFPAAIAINRVLFGGKGKLIGAFNKAFLAQGKLKGHVVVKFGGRLWDAEGETNLENVESWGMLDPEDKDYIEEYGEGWDTTVASEVTIREIGEHINGGYGELVPKYEKRLKAAALKFSKTAEKYLEHFASGNLAISNVTAPSNGIDVGVYLKDAEGKTWGHLYAVNDDGWLRPGDVTIDPLYLNQGWGKAMYLHLLSVAKRDGLKGIMSGWGVSPSARRVWDSLKAGVAPKGERFITASKTKKAEQYNDEGFWAGEGNAASGILPVCPAKGTVCLAMRSDEVQTPNCWGTLGGAVQRGMSPQESAKVEMQEETGYHGGITLLPAFVFSSGSFRYHNFVGVIPTEFSFNPSEEHSWETDYIQWLPYAEVVADMQKNSSDYHPGLLALFRNSRDVIEKALGVQPQKTGAASGTFGKLIKMHDAIKAMPGRLRTREEAIAESVAERQQPALEDLWQAIAEAYPQSKGHLSQAQRSLKNAEIAYHNYQNSREPDFDTFETIAEVLNEQETALMTLHQILREVSRKSGSVKLAADKDQLRTDSIFSKVELGGEWQDIYKLAEMCKTLGTWVYQLDLPLKDLIATQEYVSKRKVQKSLRTKDTHIVIAKWNGNYLVADGHHRLAGKILNGEKQVHVTVVDLDAYQQWEKDQPEPEFTDEDKQNAEKFLTEMRKKYGTGIGTNVQFREEMRGYHHNQSDMTLFAEVDGKVVGYVQYSVYEGQPNVQYINSLKTRKGYGTMMMRKLQSMYPEVEINWGGTTEDGSKLYDSLQHKEVPTEHAVQFEELEKLVPEKERLEALTEAYYAVDEHSPEEKQSFVEEMDKLNGIYDRIWELEQATSGKSPVKRLIADLKTVIDKLYEKKTVSVDKLIKDQHVLPQKVEGIKKKIQDGKEVFKNIIVIPKNDGMYEVDDGNHRVEAARQLGIKEISVLVSKSNPYHDSPDQLRSAITGKTAAEQQHLFPDSQDAKFQAWFKGSKVVDANGRPQPVYHGTRSSVDFDTFSVDGPPVDDEDYEGQATSSGSGADPTALMGAHFSVEPQAANQFAMGQNWMRSRYDGDNQMPRVIQVYLRITNPKDFGSEHNLREFINQGKISGDALDILCRVETGFESWEDTDADATKETEQFFQKYETDQAFRTEQHRYLFERHRAQEGEDDLARDAAYELASQARMRLETAGHDGIHYKNVVEGGTAWIAFTPNQIKSVWAQSFDSNDQRFTASKEAAPTHGEASDPQTILYLDDTRKPLKAGCVWVQHYDDFVKYLQTHDMPDIVTFDHDLEYEHYPTPEEDKTRYAEGIPYKNYKEKTGLEAAQYIVQNKLPLKQWAVHSRNPVGHENIAELLRTYCPEGEIFLNIPFEDKMKQTYGGKIENGFRVASLKTASWIKKAAGFAFKSFRKLWHVGTMNPTDKQDNSYEGSGLSVSVNPEEWQEITRLGGDLWELTKQGNKFVNFHRLSKAQRKQIADWGVKNGYAMAAELWRHTYYDGEIEDWRYSDFDSKQKAEAELGSYGDGVEEKIEPVQGGMLATPKLEQKTLRRTISPLEIMDLLVTAYAEDELDCDGVWWADDLDPDNLSAPRGVIFPGMLASWEKKKASQPHTSAKTAAISVVQ